MLLLLSSLALARPPCDADALRKGREALGKVDARHHADLASQALAEACRFPDALERALADRNAVPPDMRRVVDLRAAEDVVSWTRACPGGVDALAEAVRLAPAEGRAQLWRACEVGRLGWVSEAEFLGADGALVSGILAMWWLQRDGVDAEMARPLARALVGLPDHEALEQREVFRGLSGLPEPK